MGKHEEEHPPTDTCVEALNSAWMAPRVGASTRIQPGERLQLLSALEQEARTLKRSEIRSEVLTQALRGEALHHLARGLRLHLDLLAKGHPLPRRPCLLVPKLDHR